jgi:hypothetical protein
VGSGQNVQRGHKAIWAIKNRVERLGRRDGEIWGNARVGMGCMEGKDQVKRWRDRNVILSHPNPRNEMPDASW